MLREIAALGEPMPMAHPQQRLVKIERVMEITQLGKSSIYKLIRDGHFPEPVHLTKRAVAWFEDEVSTWLAQRRIDRAPPGQS